MTDAAQFRDLGLIGQFVKLIARDGTCPHLSTIVLERSVESG